MSCLRRRHLSWFLLGYPLALLCLLLARIDPHVTETLFSQGIFRVLSTPISKLTSLFPFSVAELMKYTYGV